MGTGTRKGLALVGARAGLALAKARGAVATVAQDRAGGAVVVRLASQALGGGDALGAVGGARHAAGATIVKEARGAEAGTVEVLEGTSDAGIAVVRGSALSALLAADCAGKKHLKGYDPDKAPKVSLLPHIEAAAYDYYDNYWKDFWQRLKDKHSIK